MANTLRDHTQSTLVAVIAFDAASVREQVITDEVGLQGVRPVIDLYPELGVKVIHIQREVNQRTQIIALHIIDNN